MKKENSKTVSNKIKKSKKIILLLIIAVLATLGQFVAFDNVLKVFTTYDFYMNFILNFTILSIIYFTFLEDFTEKFLNDDRFLSTTKIFIEKYDNLEKKQLLTDIEKYEPIRNEQNKNNIIKKGLVGTGISYDEYIENYQKLNKKDIKKHTTLTEKQKELLINNVLNKLEEYEDIDSSKLNNNSCSNQNEAFNLNSKQTKAKYIKIRFIQGFAITLILASFRFKPKASMSVIEIATWLAMKALSIMLAINGGIKDGKNFVLIELKGDFNKKINFINRFLEWYKPSLTK